MSSKINTFAPPFIALTILSVKGKSPLHFVDEKAVIGKTNEILKRLKLSSKASARLACPGIFLLVSWFDMILLMPSTSISLLKKTLVTRPAFIQ